MGRKHGERCTQNESEPFSVKNKNEIKRNKMKKSGVFSVKVKAAQ